MTLAQLLITTLCGFIGGGAIAGALVVMGADLSLHEAAAVVCGVAAVLVGVRHADPVEPGAWRRW